MFVPNYFRYMSSRKIWFIEKQNKKKKKKLQILLAEKKLLQFNCSSVKTGKKRYFLKTKVFKLKFKFCIYTFGYILICVPNLPLNPFPQWYTGQKVLKK